jgi:phosphatidylinositol alpha-1,6-mannosyltransferase
MATKPQLLLTYDFPPMGGGIARWMGELAKHYPPGMLVVSSGHYPDHTSVDQQFPNRVDRLSLPARRLRTLQGTVLWSRRAVALAKSLQVTFVWCGNLKPAAYPARWVMKRTGVPYGVLLHGGDLLILREQVRRSLVKRETARALLASASVLVTNSAWTAALCREVLDVLRIGELARLIRTVHLGADPLMFQPGLDQSLVRDRYHLQGRRWLLSVARLTRHKGIDTGIKVLAEIGSIYPDLGYVVVGSGDELAALEDLSRRLGVGDRVRFLTGVPDRDLPALYNCAEVYLGLSRLMRQRVEGFEASASGVPVVATRTGGIVDAVRHEETGLLIPADQPDQIVAALRRLLDDPALAARLGAAGRRAVETYYNWGRVAADLAELGSEAGGSARLNVVRR